MFLDFTTSAVGGAVAGLVSFYERGLACACPSATMDLIEAHKWFNLAALSGDDRGAGSRSNIALDMTAREVAEAQRRARTFLRG
jgi:hypothetical protein